MEPGSVVHKITNRVADREGVRPVDLETPLNTVIDTDALEALTEGTGFRQCDSYPRVEFLYYGYLVTVEGTERVTVTDPTNDPAVLSGESAESSLETIASELTHRETALNRASAIMAAHDQSFDEQVTDLLEVVRTALGMEYATLSYVDADTYVFEAVATPTDVSLQAGETVPLVDLPNCQRVVETEQSLVLQDVEAKAPDLADATWGIASYIGAPVFVDGEIYGTFCFYGMEARAEEFSAWDRTFVELLSNWVSDKLEHRHRERALHARTFERPPV